MLKIFPIAFSVQTFVVEEYLLSLQNIFLSVHKIINNDTKIYKDFISSFAVFVIVVVTSLVCGIYGVIMKCRDLCPVSRNLVKGS